MRFLGRVGRALGAGARAMRDKGWEGRRLKQKSGDMAGPE